MPNSVDDAKYILKCTKCIWPSFSVSYKDLTNAIYFFHKIF